MSRFLTALTSILYSTLDHVEEFQECDLREEPFVATQVVLLHRTVDQSASKRRKQQLR